MERRKPPSHDSLIDAASLGPEPSADYLMHVDVLDNVVRDCIHVSRAYAGIASPTSRHYYASVLFTAMITRSVSLAQLIPFTPWAEKKIEHWDYSSATGIARTVLELRVAFYYLCTETCSAEEWDCRWNLFNLHDCTSRVRLFQSFPGEDGQVTALSAAAEDLKSRLRKNLWFSALSDGVQRKLLNGQSAYLSPLEELAERAGLLKGTFRWLYVLFSSHVHALPMSFYRMGTGENERGRGLPSPTEEGYTSLCVSLVCSLLVKTRDEMSTLFGDLAAPPADKAEAEPVPWQDSDVADARSELAIGESATVGETEDLTLSVVKRGEDDFELVYTHRPTADVVLRRIDSKDEAALQDLDPFFWTVLLNNGPATEAQLERIDGRYAFRVDHAARTVHFKTDE
jgi:hypothetical protein